MTLPSLNLIRFEPPGKSVVASAGTTLLEAANRAGLRLPSTCGGQGDCGECCIKLLEGIVSSLTATEREHLSSEQIQDGYRLACCTRVHGAVRVNLPYPASPSEPALHTAGKESSASHVP
jgi:uncharacterized 2Fe-2S/4Fe-4S cluster protein (DUF4445 family)